MNSSQVLLISFYNQKALGIRYLENALKNAGFSVNLVFFKGFNSENPEKCTQAELDLLRDFIKTTKPEMIGLSVMTSLYLETVYAVNDMLRENFDIPILWGGVYPTLFPEKSLEHADYVIRGEGEETIVELAGAVLSKTPADNIKNLAFKLDGQVVKNEVRPVCQNLDELGYPRIGGENKFSINGTAITEGDPILNSLSFELTASRGCPFVCSYCCSVNLKRVYKGMGKYVRFRSVSSVMDELNEAKAKLKNLKVIHFWDEIFSDDENWIDEFIDRYKKEINLPFEIWAHPLKVDRNLIGKLVSVGLYKVVMGIQSGSPRVRKEIFHRVEKQEDIIEASRVLSDCKVPQVIFDFMLQHPFEKERDIRETYELCMKLKRPFELQLHGLNFLPGTDIVDKALEMNILDRNELERIMYSPIHEQYDMYWGYKNKDAKSNFWYSLTFLTQFAAIKPVTRILADKHDSSFFIGLAPKLYRLSKPLTKLRYFYNKGTIVLRGLASKR